MSDAAPPPGDQSLLTDRIRQVLAAATEPLAFAAVKKEVPKLYPEGTKKSALPKPKDVQQALDAAVARKEIFEHPAGKGKVKYAVTPAPPSPEAVVRDLVLATLRTGDGPFTPAELAEMPPTLKEKEFKKALAAVLGELIVEGKLFEHGTGKAKRYAAFPAPPTLTAEEIVRAEVLTTLDTKSGPFTEKELAKKPSGLKPAAFKEALASVVRELVAQGKLFEHPGKTKRYGTEPFQAPLWHEVPPFAKPYTAIVKSVNKLLDLGGVTAEQLVAALRVSLNPDTPAPATAPEPPRPVSPVRPATPPADAPDLRAALKDAYDYLCRFVEFRDKLVELPRLFHETAKRRPGLTVDAFRDELWQLSREHRVELHVLNEVAQAEERELAIFRDDRLYYYARWK